MLWKYSGELWPVGCEHFDENWVPISMRYVSNGRTVNE
jgi:hypothetical protein